MTPYLRSGCLLPQSHSAASSCCTCSAPGLAAASYPLHNTTAAAAGVEAAEAISQRIHVSVDEDTIQALWCSRLSTTSAACCLLLRHACGQLSAKCTPCIPPSNLTPAPHPLRRSLPCLVPALAVLVPSQCLRPSRPTHPPVDVPCPAMYLHSG